MVTSKNSKSVRFATIQCKSAVGWIKFWYILEQKIFVFIVLICHFCHKHTGSLSLLLKIDGFLGTRIEEAPLYILPSLHAMMTLANIQNSLILKIPSRWNFPHAEKSLTLKILTFAEFYLFTFGKLVFVQQNCRNLDVVQI